VAFPALAHATDPKTPSGRRLSGWWNFPINQAVFGSRDRKMSRCFSRDAIAGVAVVRYTAHHQGGWEAQAESQRKEDGAPPLCRPAWGRASCRPAFRPRRRTKPQVVKPLL